MSAPKTKSIANGTNKSKGPATSNSSAPVASLPAKAPGATSGKPDKAAYEAEQQRNKAEVDLLQEKLVRCIAPDSP
jgi:hypothetical protein